MTPRVCARRASPSLSASSRRSLRSRAFCWRCARWASRSAGGSRCNCRAVVVEFGGLWTGGGSTLANPHADGFLSGVLAVVIASPCTAPFMGAALGYALTETPAVTLAVFVALGVGMAVPFTLLSWFPGWRRALPRPGAWMVRLKQLLAFPLYATVAWLAWVLGAQVDNDAVMRLLATLVVIAFALWAWRAYRGGASRGVSAAAVVAARAARWGGRRLAALARRRGCERDSREARRRRRCMAAVVARSGR